MVEYLKELKGGKTMGMGVVLTNIFNAVAVYDEKARCELIDLDKRFTSEVFRKGLIKSIVAKLIGNPQMWIRIKAKGVSETTLDFIRRFFPGVIAGHDTLRNAKVLKLFHR